MGRRPEPCWFDEVRVLVRGVLWLVGLVVLAVIALSLAAELGDLCYTNCAAD